MELSDLDIVMDRRQSLKALTDILLAHRASDVKNVRIDYVPLDKRGEIIDLVVYVFLNNGSYKLFFPKRLIVEFG